MENNKFKYVLLRLLSWLVDLAILLFLSGVSLSFLDQKILGLWPFSFLPLLVAHSLYFGLLESRLCGGASLGKRLFSLRVVTPDFQFLDPIKSVLRGTLLCFVWVLPQVRNFFPGMMGDLIAAAGISFLVGWGISVIIDRNNRSMMEQWLSQRVVFKASSALENQPFNYRLIVASIFIIFFGVFAVFYRSSKSNISKKPSIDLWGEIQNELKEKLNDPTVQLTVGGPVEHLNTGSLVTVSSTRLLPWDGVKVGQLGQQVSQVIHAHSNSPMEVNIRVELKCQKFMGLVSWIVDCGTSEIID